MLLVVHLVAQWVGMLAVGGRVIKGIGTHNIEVMPSVHLQVPGVIHHFEQWLQDVQPAFGEDSDSSVHHYT